MKHLLDVAGQDDCFFPEAGQHTNQGVQLIRFLKQMFVKRFVFCKQRCSRTRQGFDLVFSDDKHGNGEETKLCPLLLSVGLQEL